MPVDILRYALLVPGAERFEWSTSLPSLVRSLAAPLTPPPVWPLNLTLFMIFSLTAFVSLSRDRPLGRIRSNDLSRRPRHPPDSSICRSI